MIGWERTDTAFVDMDGMLANLHFDNHSWQKLVPQR